MKCVVFLGNPGREYERTRHNAGFLLCDYLYPGENYLSKFHSFFFKDGPLMIMKPLTYMNLSGTAVSECASFFKLERRDFLVVHDDMELPPGEAKLQAGGGTKGHNGLKSIRDRLGGEDFVRLRIGIGRPVHGDVKLYVTTPFTRDEMIVLTRLFDEIKREWPLKSTEKTWKS